MNKSIVEINILGDFCVQNIESLKIGHELQSILDKGDINIVNFESPVHTHTALPISKSGPTLSQAEGAPAFLEKHGFNAFCLANNHIMDYGEKALRKTQSLFDDSILLGAGSFDDAYRVKYVEKNGIKIGLLSLCQYEFGIHGEKCDSGDRLGIAWMCHPVVDEIITVSKKHADRLIILPHAGLEQFEYPLPELVSLYHHWINLGADCIIGCHPHIAQPWEIYNNCPIVYSLGNFCFDFHNKTESWYNGLMAHLTIGKEHIEIEVKPLHFSLQENNVEITDDINYLNILKNINTSFQDNELYIRRVNEKCLSLASYYETLYELSGYYRAHFMTYMKLGLKAFVYKYILHKNIVYSDCSLINNVRCETHRWVQSRIFELQNNR